jgi:hypothetical protein
MSIRELDIVGVISYGTHPLNGQRLCFRDAQNWKYPSRFGVIVAASLFSTSSTGAGFPQVARSVFCGCAIGPADDQQAIFNV